MVSCSIVIPTHNRAELLPRAVQSALAACPADGEVVVVDDKSVLPAVQVLQRISDQRLRIVSHTGPSGASSARNLGVASARGDLVFFLDDDDEMVADYCRRVLTALAQGDRALAWGFSSTVQRRPQGDSLQRRKRLGRGPVAASASPRDQVAAMSDGFWIRRAVFQSVGGLDPAQAIDEDTDLCVRLLAAGHRAWHEVLPGAVVYRDYLPAADQGRQLTVDTPALRGLDCYRRTYFKNAPAFRALGRERWFMATRYLRRAVKAGRRDLAWTFVSELDSWPQKLATGLYLLAKMSVHARSVSNANA